MSHSLAPRRGVRLHCGHAQLPPQPAYNTNPRWQRPMHTRDVLVFLASICHCSHHLPPAPACDVNVQAAVRRLCRAGTTRYVLCACIHAHAFVRGLLRLQVMGCGCTTCLSMRCVLRGCTYSPCERARTLCTVGHGPSMCRADKGEVARLADEVNV